MIDENGRPAAAGRDYDRAEISARCRRSRRRACCSAVVGAAVLDSVRAAFPAIGDLPRRCGLRDRAARDAGLLGRLQSVAGVADQVAAAPFRSFGDLSVDRRDLHAVHRADEERPARDHPARRRLDGRGGRDRAEAGAAGALRPSLDRALSAAQLERRDDVRRDRRLAGLDAVAARRRRACSTHSASSFTFGKVCGSRTRSGTCSWCSPPRATTRL